MKIIVIFLAALLAFLVPALAADAGQGKEIVAIFRLDDYSERSNTNIELKIIQAFRQQGIPLTIAVIPAISEGTAGGESPAFLGTEKIGILKEGYGEGLIDIILHGYTHERHSTNALGEFPGLDYDLQKEKMRKGKELMQEWTGAPITSFAPPWNKYDANTLKALVDLQFKTLSASLETTAELHPGLSYLPCTCYLTDLVKAVEAARKSSEPRTQIVVLLHPYDFIAESDGETTTRFKKLQESLAWLNTQPDVTFSTISREGKEMSNGHSRKMLLNGEIDDVLAFLPIDGMHDHYYYKSHDSHYYEAWIRVGLFYLLILMVSIDLGGRVTSRVQEKSQFLFTVSKYGSALLFLAISAYVLHDFKVHAKGLVACTVTLGMMSGPG